MELDVQRDDRRWRLVSGGDERVSLWLTGTGTAAGGRMDERSISFVPERLRGHDVAVLVDGVEAARLWRPRTAPVLHHRAEVLDWRSTDRSVGFWDGAGLPVVAILAGPPTQSRTVRLADPDAVLVAATALYVVARTQAVADRIAAGTPPVLVAT